MMKRTCYILTMLPVIWLVVCVIGCTPSGKTESPQLIKSPTGASTVANQELTSLIGDILTQKGWEGKEVTVVGYYRGWDLLGETDQAPPVTRSDWVIKDNSGAMYIQANDIEIKGQEQLGGNDVIRPDKKEAINHVMRVTGIVRITQERQFYIEPTYIELVR